MVLSEEIVQLLKDTKWICANSVGVPAYRKRVHQQATRILADENRVTNFDKLELNILRRNMSALLKKIAHELEHSNAKLATVTPDNLRDVAYTMAISGKKDA